MSWRQEQKMNENNWSSRAKTIDEPESLGTEEGLNLNFETVNIQLTENQQI